MYKREIGSALFSEGPEGGRCSENHGYPRSAYGGLGCWLPLDPPQTTALTAAFWLAGKSRGQNLILSVGSQHTPRKAYSPERSEPPHHQPHPQTLPPGVRGVEKAPKPLLAKGMAGTRPCESDPACLSWSWHLSVSLSLQLLPGTLNHTGQPGQWAGVTGSGWPGDSWAQPQTSASS